MTEPKSGAAVLLTSDVAVVRYWTGEFVDPAEIEVLRGELVGQ